MLSLIIHADYEGSHQCRKMWVMYFFCNDCYFDILLESPKRAFYFLITFLLQKFIFKCKKMNEKKSLECLPVYNFQSNLELLVNPCTLIK